MGVDNDLHKIIDCVARGVPVYQGDILDVLGIFPDNSFDWVVCSRTIQELAQPPSSFERALAVGRRVAVGFVNHGLLDQSPEHALARPPGPKRGLPGALV